eukprot:scaffold317012_cov30-Tisochrysis_lutea.AAC.4
MCCKRESSADAHRSTDGVGARTEMSDRAKEFKRVALLLQRVRVSRALANKFHERLCDHAGDGHGSACTLKPSSKGGAEPGESVDQLRRARWQKTCCRVA